MWHPSATPPGVTAGKGCLGGVGGEGCMIKTCTRGCPGEQVGDAAGREGESEREEQHNLIRADRKRVGEQRGRNRADATCGRRGGGSPRCFRHLTFFQPFPGVTATSF